MPKATIIIALPDVDLASRLKNGPMCVRICPGSLGFSSIGRPAYGIMLASP